MAASFWEVCLPNKRKDISDRCELLEQKQQNLVDSPCSAGEGDKLPPRVLALRSTLDVARTAVYIELLVVIVVVSLCILAVQLRYFLPDTNWLGLDDTVSCDLTTKQASKLEAAFTINLRSSTHFTFTQAKAIDVIWQLFGGAGGRFVMAWISYKVFMDGITRLAEESPVTYDLYASLTFSTTSLFTVCNSLAAMYSSKGWKVKAFLFWFAVSTIYVLGFPTLMSATAGYLAPSTLGYNMTDGTFLQPKSPDLRNCFKIFDGSLVGYSNGIALGPPVSVFDVNKTTGVNEATGAAFQCAAIESDKFGVDTDKQLCNLLRSLLKNSSFTHEYSLFASLVNITAFGDITSYREQAALPTPNATIDGRPYKFGLGEAFEAAYCYNNKTIPSMRDAARCLPESYFVWGFSSLMVRVNIALFIVWIVGMYLVWLDAQIYSALCRSGRKVRGPFRAVMDLSEAMREVLGYEICAYPDSELASELSKQPGVRYYASDSQDSNISHIGLSSIGRNRVPYSSKKMYGQEQ